MSGTNIIKLIEHSGWGVVFYQTGHVDKNEFVKEIEKEFDRVIPIELVRHGIVRFVPKYSGGSMLLLRARKKRGAFLATYVEVI